MKEILKRIFDIILSATLLVIFSPILLIVAVLVRFKLGKPIFFKQQRPGKNNKIFTMIKFRTMTDEKDQYGKLLDDSIRLTKFGKFLRSSSLDELPEILNVFKGNMSFVGPRPLLVEYLDRYTLEQARRHEVKPGITGWAQINGRNALSWEEKFNLDVWYVDNWSILLDIKILFMTFFKVLKRDGISSQEHVTMEKFMGYEKNGDDNQ